MLGFSSISETPLSALIVTVILIGGTGYISSLTVTQLNRADCLVKNAGGTVGWGVSTAPANGMVIILVARVG